MTDERIDIYIAKAAEFALPILSHLRKLVHVACPKVEETIKWGMPCFDYNGSIMCSMASFKQHCGFSFWRADVMEDPHGVLEKVGKTSMGSLGKLTDKSDLPSDKILKEYIKEAMKLNEQKATKAAPKKVVKVVPTDTPEYFLKALKKNKQAMAHFEAFSPSAKKEYIQWLEDAKTDATRDKRMADAVEWISEGKTRHWKYQK